MLWKSVRARDHGATRLLPSVHTDSASLVAAYLGAESEHASWRGCAGLERGPSPGDRGTSPNGLTPRPRPTPSLPTCATCGHSHVLVVASGHQHVPRFRRMGVPPVAVSPGCLPWLCGTVST